MGHRNYYFTRVPVKASIGTSNQNHSAAAVLVCKVAHLKHLKVILSFQRREHGLGSSPNRYRECDFRSYPFLCKKAGTHNQFQASACGEEEQKDPGKLEGDYFAASELSRGVFNGSTARMLEEH